MDDRHVLGNYGLHPYRQIQNFYLTFTLLGLSAIELCRDCDRDDGCDYVRDRGYVHVHARDCDRENSRDDLREDHCVEFA